jgi:tetratricopeptide (TPR) repeat protein
MTGKLTVCLVALAMVQLGFQVVSHTPSQGNPLAAQDSAQEHLGAGLKLFEVERYSEAIKELRLALDSDPGLLEARYYLAVSCFNERRYQEAREQFERLLSLGYQKDWVPYYLGRLDLAGGHLGAAIGRFQSLKRPEPLADELYYLGSALLKEGEAAQAVLVLERQIRFNPRDFRAHSLLARAYMKIGHSREAEEEFEKSEGLHQYYLQGKQELAVCRNNLAAGHPDQAWAQCGSALATDDIDKLVAVGMLFGEFRGYGYAIQAFRRALSLDPESPEINYNLGFTYFQQKEYGEARKFLEAALHLRPDFFEALAVDGTALYQLHQDSAARRVLDRAHALRPDDETVSRLLAQIDEGNHR